MTSIVVSEYKRISRSGDSGVSLQPKGDERPTRGDKGEKGV